MEKKTQQTISEQLEPLAWRTTQREQDSGYEQMATPPKWGAILTAIMQFQNEHEGRSPSNPLIAQAAGLSVGQVQYHLVEMAKRGLVHDKEGWPRRLIVTASAKVAAQQEPAPEPKAPKQEEVKVMHSADFTKAGEPRKKRERFMVMAKKFAEALTDHYDKYGEAPMLKDIGPALGYSKDKPVGASRLVKEMVARGWLFHKPNCHADFVLTGLGRAVLFNEPLREDVHTDMIVRSQINPRATDLSYADRMAMMRSSPMEDTKPSPEKEPEPPQKQPEARREPSPLARIMEPKPQPGVPGPEEMRGINLAKVDSVDLVLELQARGFRVSR